MRRVTTSRVMLSSGTSRRSRYGGASYVVSRLVKAVAARRMGFGMPRSGKARRSLYGAVCCVTVSRGTAVN